MARASSRSNIPTFKLVLCLVAIAALPYLQSLRFEYVLDDVALITKNRFTQAGFRGVREHLRHDMMAGYADTGGIVQGGRYRPLSGITFCVEQSLLGSTPHLLKTLRHGTNLLLYTAVTVLLFSLLRTLGRPPMLSFWVCALFAAHPTHVESVANIKGRDDILLLVFALLALLACQLEHQAKRLTAVGLCTFLACLSKEIGVAVPLLVGALLWLQASPKRALLLAVGISVGGALLFLLLRQAALTGETPPAELMNQPFLHAETGEKTATMFLTWAYYAKLLFVPWPLTIDYYPYHIPLVRWSSPLPWIGVLLTLAALSATACSVRRRSLAALGLLMAFCFFLPVSNLLFPVGTFMAERFLFAPSAGLLLALAFILPHQTDLTRFALPVVILGLIITAIRTSDWKDERTLLAQDVITSERSAFSNHSYATVLLRSDQPADRSLARQYLERAVEIHPDYQAALEKLMLVQHEQGEVQAALVTGRRILQLNPRNVTVHINLGIWLRDAQMYPEAIRHLQIAVACAPESANARYHLGLTLMRMFWSGHGDVKALQEDARFHLAKAHQLAPERTDIMQQLGGAHFVAEDFESAARCWREVMRTAPNRSVAQTLAACLDKLNRPKEANALRRQYP